MTKNEKKKTKIKAGIAILSLLVIAILCFLFGFAISEGWEAVGAWFTSKWAVMTIVAVSCVAIIAVFLLFFVKDREDFK